MVGLASIAAWFYFEIAQGPIGQDGCVRLAHQALGCFIGDPVLLDHGSANCQNYAACRP